MSEKLVEISPYNLKINPFEVFNGRWMLLTAGNEASGCNTMTISWGQLGNLWQDGSPRGPHYGLPVATVFVRPQRYTKKFMDTQDYFTIALYSAEYKKALAYLGAKSGRDEDKVAAQGMSPVFVDNTSYISGAELVLICRKLYQAPILGENFIDQNIIEKTYPQKDYHDMYIGQIEKVLVAPDLVEQYTMSSDK